MNSTLQRSWGNTRKLQQLGVQLHALAMQLGPGAKLPTVLQLCQETGVSIATLNTALKELEAQHIITRKHGVGIYVSERLHQKTVSLICDSSFFRTSDQSPFWDILLNTAGERATSHDELFEMHLAQPYGSLGAPLQRGLAQDIADGRVHGLIGVGLDRAATQWIQSQNVPFVSLFGPELEPPPINVNLDSDALVERGIEVLDARGCTRMALWNQPARPNDGLLPSVNQLRSQGFERALKRLGHDFDAGRVEPNETRVDDNSAHQSGLSKSGWGFQIASRIFGGARESWPDGVLLTDDVVAHGALMAMQKLDVRLGRDIHVVTHANRGSTTLLGHEGPLTLLEFDPADMVDTLFGLLERRMNGDKIPGGDILIAPRVIEI